VKTGRLIVSGLLVTAGLVSAAHGQEANRPRVLLFGVTETAPPVEITTYTRDDLRPVGPAASRLEKLAESVQVTVAVGDPYCLPGHLTTIGPPPRPSRNSRSR
jgi:hypothetical protein